MFFIFLGFQNNEINLIKNKNGFKRYFINWWIQWLIQID